MRRACAERRRRRMIDEAPRTTSSSAATAASAAAPRRSSPRRECRSSCSTSATTRSTRAEANDVLFLAGTAPRTPTSTRRASTARAGVIASADSDAQNLYITLSARPRRPELMIVARASDEEAERKLRLAGADRVVQPYSNAGVEMAKLAVRPEVAAFLEIVTSHGGPDLRFEEIEITADYRRRAARSASCAITALDRGASSSRCARRTRPSISRRTPSAARRRRRRDRDGDGHGAAGARGSPRAAGARWRLIPSRAWRPRSASWRGTRSSSSGRRPRTTATWRRTSRCGRRRPRGGRPGSSRRSSPTGSRASRPSSARRSPGRGS